MRKTLLVLFCLVLIIRTKAQVVFCPPGAEWNYRYFNLPTWGGVKIYQNETIKYMRDSVTANGTYKVLIHTKFYLDCNQLNEIKLTLIRQNGDTVFFKNNKTQDTWQILYNYACLPGTGWQTTILNGNNTPITYNYTVSSVTNTTINGYNLKQLNMGGYYISERFGWNSFLFNYNSHRGCDGYYFYDCLCYSDNLFGLAQFTDKPCYFSGIDAIDEYQTSKLLKIFPNPANDVLNLKLNAPLHKAFNIKISDLSGREVERIELEANSELQINTISYHAGVYLANIFYNGQAVEVKRLMIVR